METNPVRTNPVAAPREVTQEDLQYVRKALQTPEFVKTLVGQTSFNGSDIKIKSGDQE